MNPSLLSTPSLPPTSPKWHSNGILGHYLNNSNGMSIIWIMEPDLSSLPLPNGIQMASWGSMKIMQIAFPLFG